MKKFINTLMTIGGAALAIFGGICLYRKFFPKEDEFAEDFDDDDLFDDLDTDEEEEEEIKAFDSEEEIFEEEPSVKPNTSTSESSETQSN